MRYGPRHDEVAKFVNECSSYPYLTKCGGPYPESPRYVPEPSFEEAERIHDDLIFDLTTFPLECVFGAAHRSISECCRAGGWLSFLGGLIGLGALARACRHVDKDIERLVERGRLEECTRKEYNSGMLGFLWITNLMKYVGKLLVVGKLSEHPAVSELHEIVRRGYLPLDISYDDGGRRYTIH